VQRLLRAVYLAQVLDLNHSMRYLVKGCERRLARSIVGARRLARRMT
jgi:hypothetical protein